MNIQEIRDTIIELEKGETTFASCQKLASLYIVRDKFQPTANKVESELSDILPQYKEYCSIKRRYQLGEIESGMVVTALQGVCKEITEFIQILYGSTDMPTERELLRQMTTGLLAITK